MKALELVEIEDGLGLILPEEVIRQLRIELDDEVHVVATEQGFSLHSNHSDAKVNFQIAKSNAVDSMAA